MMLPCGCYVDKRGRKMATCPKCNGNYLKVAPEQTKMLSHEDRGRVMRDAWARRKARKELGK